MIIATTDGYDNSASIGRADFAYELEVVDVLHGNKKFKGRLIRLSMRQTASSATDKMIIEKGKQYVLFLKKGKDVWWAYGQKFSRALSCFSQLGYDNHCSVISAA